MAKNHRFLLWFASFAIAMALGWLRFGPGFSSPDGSTPPSAARRQTLPAQATRLEARERRLDETVWAPEMLAQSCARTIETLWDSLNAATNKLRLAAAFPFGEIVLPRWNPPQILPHGIILGEPSGPGATLSADPWRPWVQAFDSAGWRLDNTEFRHLRFDPDPSGRPGSSHFYFSAHFSNPERSERASLEGDLGVDWGTNRPPGPIITTPTTATLPTSCSTTAAATSLKPPKPRAWAKNAGAAPTAPRSWTWTATATSTSSSPAISPGSTSIRTTATRTSRT